MISFNALIVFTLSSILLALAPGPDNIFVMSQSVLYGRRAGAWVSLGLCSGLIVHTAAVALGVAAFFQNNELAFICLKLLGAAYLLYLAWQSWRAVSSSQLHALAQLSARALYWRGVAMNLTNPKVTLFFLAFLPQFADSKLGYVPQQIMLLGGLFMLSAGLAFMGMACAAAQIGEYCLRRPIAQVYVNKLAALVFIGIAGHLLYSTY